MSKNQRVPMPDMGRVQNQTTFRQLDNVRAAKVDGDIPRNAGAFAEGFESLTKLTGQLAQQRSKEEVEAAEKAKIEDQKLQALVLDQGARGALTEFQQRLDANPDKLGDDDWVAAQADELRETKALKDVTDEFLIEKGKILFQGGVDQIVSGTRQKADEIRKVGIVSDALIRVTEDLNGAIANNPAGKDGLVATGKVTIEHILNGLGMPKHKAIPLLVAIAQRDAKEGKHNTFLASVLKDDPDLPAEIRMQMETFEAEGMAATAIERELARTDLYTKIQPNILNGTYTVSQGREWVERGIISADTNISWANQARSNRERMLKEAQEKRKAAEEFGKLAAAGNSVEGFWRLTSKQQDATKDAWQAAFQQKYGKDWVGPYLMQLRSVGAKDDDIENLAKATIGGLTGMVSKEGEVPGAVRALVQNPKVIAAYQSGTLAHHMNLEMAQRIIPLLDKYHTTGPDMAGHSPLVDAFNLAASANIFRPVKADTLKVVNSSVLSKFRDDPWFGPKKADTSQWKGAEQYAAWSYEQRIGKGATPKEAAAGAYEELQGKFTKGSKGYVPTELARLHPRGADGVSDLIHTQITTLAKSFGGNAADIQYHYDNGRIFFMKNGMPISNTALSANVISSGKGEEFVRGEARKEIKK